MRLVSSRTLMFTVISCTLLFLFNCQTGSETGNPDTGLVGRVRSMDGKVSANTQIILVPRNYNPLALLSEISTDIYTDTTDVNGKFNFRNLDTGTYNLQAYSLVNGQRAQVKNLLITKSVQVNSIQLLQLQLPCKINLSLSGVTDTINSYVFILGTTYYQKIAKGNTSFIFDSLPSGIVDSIVLGSQNNSLKQKTFAWNVATNSNQVANVSGIYLEWKYSANVFFNTTNSGALLTKNVFRFPLRIPLEDVAFDFSQSQSKGLDIRVTTENGVPLPCEIQAYDSTKKTGNLWVLVDTVYAQKIQSVRMYWGYQGTTPIPATWPSGSVFNSQDGYVASWHLDEDPFLNNNQIKDFSGTQNTGLAVGYTTASTLTPGIIGNALNLDGKTQFMGSTKSFYNPDVFTYCGWFKSTAGSGGRLFEFTDSSMSEKLNYWDRLVHLKMDGSLLFGLFPPLAKGVPMLTSGQYKTLSAGMGLNDGQWHQVAASMSPEGQALFIDGIKLAFDPNSIDAEIILGFWRIGFGKAGFLVPTNEKEYFQGSIDEVWIAHAKRSDEFISLSYKNLKPGGTLFKVP